MHGVNVLSHVSPHFVNAVGDLIGSPLVRYSALGGILFEVIPFAAGGPFVVHVERDGPAWLVICRDHGWLHGDRHQANAEAVAIACGFGVHARTAASP
jgi:hypothetical protein